MTDVVWSARGDDEAVAERVASVIVRSGPKRIAVPGGKTPGAILATLAKRDLPWEKVEVAPTDDRLVPADHPASNFGQLRHAFARLPARLMPLTEGSHPAPFDLVWLGMGADGHVASLFPNIEVSASGTPEVVRVRPDPLPPEAPFERLSLNLAALIRSDDIIVVVRGAEKRAVIEAAVEGRVDLPITRLLAAAPAPVTIFWSPS